jgi:hypothetical protein
METKTIMHQGEQTIVELKPSNPKDAAATNRLDLSLFPATARAYGALAMVEGDQKYGGYNYRAAGVNASIYYAAAGRHLDKWYNGENDDPITGVPHLANAIACIAVLIDGIEMGNWTDDRPPSLDLTRLLSNFEKRVGKVKEVFPRRTERFIAKTTST